MPVTPIALVSHLMLSLSASATLSLMLPLTLSVMLWFEVVLLLLMLPLTIVDCQAVLVLLGLVSEPQLSGKERLPCSFENDVYF